VIGNPPYVEAKKLKYIASTLKKRYDFYSGTADFSIYFIEQGLNLIHAKGVLCLITTNKFFNTGYGQQVRAKLSSLHINELINFEQVEVFKDILVSSVVINVRKEEVQVHHDFVYERFYKMKCEEFKAEFVRCLASLGTYPQDFLDSNEWSFADASNLLLKRKMENSATPLGEVAGVNIYRGVTTGYNPAFIISDSQKDELVSKDPCNTAVIKNLLQGRNIRKWRYNESDENLIFTRKGFDIDAYPIIKEHLLPFYDNLKPKKESNEKLGRKPGKYKWFEILDNTAYYPEFEKPEKIIWGLTADKWAFAYDDKQHYLPSNGYILTSANVPIKYLLGLLNSKLMHHYFGYIGVMTAGGAYTLKAATISALPFKQPTDTSSIENLVDRILSDKRQDKDADTSAEERDIDCLVYKLYGLTYDEVLTVDPNTLLKEEEYNK